MITSSALATPVDIGDVNGDGTNDFATLSSTLTPNYIMLPSLEFDPVTGMFTTTLIPVFQGYTASYVLSVDLDTTTDAMDGVSGFVITYTDTMGTSIVRFGAADQNNDGYQDVFLTIESYDYLVYGHTTHDIVGGADADLLSGANGGDTMSGNDGNDILRGGGWADALNGGGGDDTLNGGDGDDTMTGGTGDDTYIVREAGDVVIELADEGLDTVRTDLASYTLADNVEFLILATGGVSGTGNGLNNEIRGNAAANTLDGADGDDTLFGFGGKDTLLGGEGADQLSGGAGHDTLDGGAGDDRLHGGLGVDRLTGGTGADTYMFTSADLMSGRSFDIIEDFSQSDGDTIDFSAFDADRTSEGQQGFTFIGTGLFTGHAGELRYVYDAVNDYTYVRGDLDGDGKADISIRLDGQIDLIEGDFNLFVPS